MRSETCSRCGQEIRFGTRDGRIGWWHQGDVDHGAILGRPFTREDQAEVERQLDLPRTRETSDGEIETYTTREHDRAKMSKAKREALDTEDEIEPEPIPAPEVLCHPIEVDDLRPRSGARQVANLVLRTDGWELRRLTHARGPYVGARGDVLSISDSIVLGARHLDSGRIVVVGWRDYSFDFAHIGTVKNGHLSPERVDATTMKNWIRTA